MGDDVKENQKLTTLKAMERERLKRESKAGVITYGYKHLGHKLIRLPLDSYDR